MASRIGKLVVAFKPTNILATLLVVALGYGAYTAYDLARRSTTAEQAQRELEQAVGTLEKQNARLRTTVTSLEAQCARLRSFVARLTTESRVATLRILASHPDGGGVPITTFEFAEQRPDGRPRPSRVFTVRGRELYVDALVIKFTDDAVKVADPLRGKSLHLFRRVFGSAQEPREGPLVAASQPDGVPAAYAASGEASDFEQRMWRLFWYWASHPAEAASQGVRVAQIEAVGIRPIVGATYRLTLEHDGGLNIKQAARP